MSPQDSSKYDRRNRFDLRTLLDTSRLLIESHDADFVCNHLLLISMGKLMISKAAILWYQPAEKNYFLSQKKGKFDFPDTLNLPAEVFKEQRVYFCDEIPELKPLCDLGINLVVAIQNSDHHFGLLALGPKVGNLSLNRDDIDILEGFVYMSAIALSNSELVGELKSANRKLDFKVQELHTLFDLSKAFNASTDREEIKRLFKYTLLGHHFIRRFFLVGCRDNQPVILAESGIKEKPDKNTLQKLFSINNPVSFVNETSFSSSEFLKENHIHLLIKLNHEDGDPAILALGKRANGLEYEHSDFNFLTSLGNLVFMSIQKTYLLEDRIEKERMEEELNIARNIQQKLFPSTIPEINGLRVAASNVPSFQVGGDYYDLISNGGEELTIAIADVTGKGVPASLIMANLQSILHILHPINLPLNQITGQINDLIYNNTPADKFVSFFWGCYHSENRTFRYVNAGHNPPVLIKKHTDTAYLSDGGVLLGAMPTLSPYVEGQITLEKGDILVMYTDGVTEAMNDSFEEYGEARLIRLIQKHRDLNPDTLLEKIVSDVDRFCESAFSDDLTIIVCQVV
ncbi:SpoIIE family protein phosphatase [Balneolaceae bacterium ANBcel3]|nr:SpoIIE family protein phosphatase [Balneolaceae bacterium ANBcel3]